MQGRKEDMSKSDEEYLICENERLLRKIEQQKHKIRSMEDINRKMFIQLQLVSSRMHNYEEELHHLISDQWDS